jgi:hypothetical protein
VTDRHVVQLASDLFTAVENVFTAQFEHTSVPTEVLYFPATHPVHSTPSGPVYPALHLHIVIMPLATADCVYRGQASHVLNVAATTVEYVSATQLVHTAEPLVGLNVPASHAAQGTSCPTDDPPAPVYPMLQMHAAKALLPRGDWLEVGHARQFAPVVEKDVIEYLSCAHRVQSSGPNVILNVPGTQA